MRCWLSCIGIVVFLGAPGVAPASGEDLEADLATALDRQRELEIELERVGSRIADLRFQIDTQRSTELTQGEPLVLVCQWETSVFAEASVLNLVARVPAGEEVTVLGHHAERWFRVRHPAADGFAILRVVSDCPETMAAVQIEMVASGAIGGGQLRSGRGQWTADQVREATKIQAEISEERSKATARRQDLQRIRARGEAELVQQKQVEAEREAAARIKAAEREARLEREYGAKIAARILGGNYWLGMTEAMAKESLGLPDSVRRTVTSSGAQEQWVYRRYEVYLYFDNGVLTSWQD